MTTEKKLDYLLAIYIAAIVSAELLGSKLTTIFGRKNSTICWQYISPRSSAPNFWAAS